MKRQTRRPRRRPAKYPNFRTYLTRSGDTQENVASKLGISQAQVSRILAGKVVPRPDVAIRLATYAQIPVDSFTWEAARQRGVL